MKKLMIAAAAAAMVGGAFANLCDDEPAETAACAVYNVKFTLKTLDAKLVKIKGTTGDCGSTDGQNCVYLDNATRTIDGIIWDCDASCGTLNTDAMKVALWEAKSKTGIGDRLTLVDSGEVDSNDNPIMVYEAADLPFGLINRYGNKAQKVQAAWELADLPLCSGTNEFGTVTLAATGFGMFDAKKELVKSISGNAVGMFTEPLTRKYTGCGDPMIADLCTEFSNWCDDGEAADTLVASGTWSVKYNASLSKGKKRLSQIVPTYAQTR